MKIIIIGAGMAGLLAGRMLRMRGHDITILEAQPSLPNNHNAVLRFRSNVVSDITGIPFRKVQMIKATHPHINPVAEAIAYSKKVTGSYSTSRSITQGLTVADRWIAPPDFITKLAEGSEILYGIDATHDFDRMDCLFDAVISTIPMPSLAKMLTAPVAGIEFKSIPGWVIKAKVMERCDAYASLYIPSNHIACYRASITGNELILEFVERPANPINEIIEILHLLGLEDYCLGAGTPHELVERPYAKIEPINEKERKRFLSWATSKHNIYSLGRYATWRPGLLLDDLVKDVRLIEGWIAGGDNYDVKKNR